MARDRLGRHGGGDRRAHQHRHAADLEVRHRRAEAALPRAGDPRRADRRARHHRARRRLGRGRAAHARRARRRRLGGQRREDLHHQRRARPLHRHRRQDDRRGRPPRHLLPDRRPRRGRRVLASSRSSAGTPPTRPRSLPGRVRARGEPARRAERGLQADHGQLPVGAPGDGARRRRRDAARLGAHRRVRARAPGLRPPALRPPGDPPQARRPGDLGLHVPLRHLRRAAPLRRRRGAAARRSRWPSC